MPRQNRVTPAGNLIATTARGQYLGNRGVLHNAMGELGERRWAHQQWIYCLLEFQAIRQPINAPGSYTQLFFLDDATALAAGHRPCRTCQPKRFREFKETWLAGNAEYGFDIDTSIKEIDRVIHGERVDSERRKVVWQDKLGNLPEGVIVELPGKAGSYYLIRDGKMWRWSAEGYSSAIDADSKQQVTVLAPKSVVSAIRAGFRLFPA